MRQRRKNLNYLTPNHRSLRNSPSPIPNYSKVSPSPTGTLQVDLGIRSLVIPKLLASGTIRSAETVEAHFPRFYEEQPERQYSVGRLRSILRLTVGTNAVLSWLVTILGYMDISMTREEKHAEAHRSNGLKFGVCVVSAAQIILIVVYWVYSLKYLEELRFSLRLSPIPYLSLLKSPQSLVSCTLECIYHLLVLPPTVFIEKRVYMLGTYTVISLDDVVFILLLLRNYHSLQLLFWSSDFCTRKTYHFASVANINVNVVFILRCYLAHYSLKLIAGVYGAIVVVSGLSLFVLEKGRPSPNFEDAADALWFMGYTQTTVGYGEITPRTYPGCLTTIISCFIGNFILAIMISLSSSTMALNLDECTMYSDILYANQKRKYTKPAIVLLQMWWRFILMRMRRKRNGPTIIAFYTQLRTYRGVLTKCQLVKDRRFERQITAFEHSTSKALRSMLEYLDPIRDAESYMTDIVRKQYSIRTITSSIKKFAKKHRVPDELSGSLPNSSRRGSVASANSYGSIGSAVKSPQYVALKRGKMLVMAQRSAYQNLKGRLLKEIPSKSHTMTVDF